VSTARKATAKKTTAARKRTTSTPTNRARMTEGDAVGAVAKIIHEDGTTAPAKDTEAEPVITVDVPLSRRGERTGKTRTVRVQRPTTTQVVWFEAAARRFNLAIDAWGEGIEFTQDERGDVFGEVISAFGVFLATPYDRAWVSTAMAEGTLELDGLIEAIEQAKVALDLAPEQGSNKRPEADVVIE
jgi:hypothetical protein